MDWSRFGGSLGLCLAVKNWRMSVWRGEMGVGDRCFGLVVLVGDGGDDCCDRSCDGVGPREGVTVKYSRISRRFLESCFFCALRCWRTNAVA